MGILILLYKKSGGNFRFLKTSKSILDIFKMSIFQKRRLENRKKVHFSLLEHNALISKIYWKKV